MLNANLILILLLIVILYNNHFKKNKGIIYVIFAIITLFIKVIGETFPITYFDHNSFILRLVLIYPLINFLIAPFILLYIESVLKRSCTLNAYFLSFIPFLFFLINFIPYFFLPVDEKIQIYTLPNYASAQSYFIWFSFPVLRTINDIYNPLLGMITIIYLFQILFRNKEKLSKKTYFNLLQLSIILVVNFITLRFLDYFNFKGENISPEIIGIIPMIMPLSILVLPNFVYDSTINSDLNFYFKLMSRLSSKGENKDSIKSELLKESSRIMNYLNEEKPSLSPVFSIHDIVSTLDIPQKNVTDSFNKVIKIPFPKMRNQLRVDHAIEMFRNNSHAKISIEGIAAESGFNNRATFYKAFREVTKTTPIEWIKQNCDYTIEEELE